ncbi:tetratricopeptide repeat protein [Sphaerisporangium rubeum]|uniref:Tetratricopeptide repeat protein n=1 Tax=Sphaerisporangium rubeum TaxID=321317 RepID=A0A7X0M715_9ACTN|nr:hypothetical protein [Sphaerisporangium rubeum]MBB6474050.1 hypothetical protein [Sphaerisporangium rubeum]
MPAQEERLRAIGAAGAAVLSRVAYHQVRTEQVAAEVRLGDTRVDRPAGGSRSAVWLYNEVKSRRVLVALAALHAFERHMAAGGWSPPDTGPFTVTDARALVTDALTEVCRFQRAEAFLMTQVGHGIGDIATSEKRVRTSEAPSRPPAWPPTPLGRVAAAAWTGRLTVFAPMLEPVLLLAARSVTDPPAGWAAESATFLSDLAFRAYLGDAYCPPGRQAAGLAAYWFDRSLTMLTGPWAGELHAAEVALTAVRRRGTDPRAEAAAQVTILRTLLEAGTLHARAAREGTEAITMFHRLAGRPALPPAAGITASGTAAARPSGTAEWSDLRSLCDAATRQGIAALRFGDIAGARAAYELAGAVVGSAVESAAEGRGTGDERRSLALRARHNIADVLIEEGRPGAGLAVAEQVHRVRSAAAAPSGTDAAWRRATLTAEVRVRALTRSGRVVAAVRAAEELVTDRRERLGGVDNVSAASARVTLAEALLAAGHPGEARHHIEDASQYRRGRLVATGYWPQYDRVLLAQAHIALGAPGAAVEILRAAPVTGEWFATRVSARLALNAHRLLALAHAALHETGLALDGLRALSETFDSRPAGDALAVVVWRDLCELLIATGEIDQARCLLSRVTQAEPPAAEDLPGHAYTLLLRTLLAAHEDGATQGVPAPREAVTAERRDVRDIPVAAADGDAAGPGLDPARAELVRLGLDPAHPVLLRVAYEEARRRGAHDPAAAAELLAPLMCRRPLAHGRPAIGDGHPLHLAARDLADQFALPGPAEPGPAWDDY